MGICLVFEYITGFLEMLMALVLSHKMSIGSSNFTWKSYRVCFIHRIWVQHATVAMYYASTVDREIEDCFLLNQATRHPPK